VVLLDAATHDQPSFGRHPEQIIAACARAREHLGPSDALTNCGEAMTDDELVTWLRSGQESMASTRAATQTKSPHHTST
jgi:hypothetical protein